jgi:hypothetical protein
LKIKDLLEDSQNFIPSLLKAGRSLNERALDDAESTIRAGLHHLERRR